jgi:Holliday junction resolvase RusA-like endonuclease
MDVSTPSGLVIDVSGVVRPQPRPRMVKGKVVSTTGQAKRWKAAVLAAMDEVAIAQQGFVELPLTGPVQLALVFRHGTVDPLLWGKPRIAVRNKDADNLAKLIMDAAVDAQLIGDDGQVANLVVWQAWSRREHEGVSIGLFPIFADLPVPGVAASMSGVESRPTWLA